MFMNSSFFNNLFLQSLTLTLLTITTIAVSDAEVRSSNSYQLQSDSVNFGGGLSESNNYSLESTAGEVATGLSDSPSYSLRAGYQQMQEVFLSITTAPDVVMSPDIGGLTGGVANGSTSVTVLTDSPGGYQLSIISENDPAMQNGADTIADYIPVAAPDPDYTFNTTATQAHFGFSPEGNDITERFMNDTNDCAVGTNKTPLTCWDGLSTTNKLIAQGLSNQPLGTVTKINFRVELGSNVAVRGGDYVATTTLTALPL